MVLYGIRNLLVYIVIKNMKYNFNCLINLYSYINDLINNYLNI